MSLWTLQNTEVTGETQWTNANYNGEIVIPIGGGTVPTQFLQVAGYTSGTISFTIDSPPVGWGPPPPQTLQISILGGIQNTTPTTIPPVPVSIFTVQTLELYNGSGGDSNLTTFYIEWNIPIEFVALSIFNNTGAERTITNIRLLTESQGGGIGFTSSSGATVGPGVPVYSLQFNNTGVFGGASGALYDATANTNTGQVQLADGSVGEPMLAFSDGTHPLGTYNTGIYRVQADTLGIATGGTQQVTVTSSSGPPPATMIRGLNVGTTATGGIVGIRRLSSTAVNSWEDGNCGNSSQLVFVPSDFMIANPTTGRGIPAQTQPSINLVGNGIDWLQASGGRYGEPVIGTATPDDCLVATKLIPKGFLIKKDGFRMTIFGITNTADFRISLAYRRIEDLTAALPPPGNVFVDPNYTLNTPVPITGLQGPGGTAAIGDGVGFLILYIQPPQVLTSTDGGIRGAIIDMARI